MISNYYQFQVNENQPDNSIGFSNITHEEVELAVDTIISQITKSYLELLKESMSKQELSLPFSSKTSGLGCLKFYESDDHIYNIQDIKNSKCYINFEVNRRNLQNNNPLDNLLNQLSKSLFDLGYTNPSGLFEIRFEKGCSTQTVDYWHFDGFKKSISVNWSSIESWSTKILNMAKVNQIDPNFKISMSGINRALNTNGYFFRFAEEAKLGYLYDVKNVCHRSPALSDLRQVPKINDYRLFIRYTE